MAALTTLTIVSGVTYPVTGSFGDADMAGDSSVDLLGNLVMVCGTARTLQSFNNSTLDGTSGYWLCAEHYNTFVANGGLATAPTGYDAGRIINAALAWSSALNLSQAYGNGAGGGGGENPAAPPFPRVPVQTARVLITERATYPLVTAITVPDAGNCFIESISGETLVNLAARLDTKHNGAAIDGVITNTTNTSLTTRPSNVKLSGFSISKPWSYVTGWFDGVLRSMPLNERDGTAGDWTGLTPMIAAPISTNFAAVAAMQLSGGSLVYFDNVTIDPNSKNPQIFTRTVTVAGGAVTTDPITGSGAALNYSSSYTLTNQSALNNLANITPTATVPGVAGFNLRLLGLGCYLSPTSPFVIINNKGRTWTGSLVPGTGTGMGGNGVPPTQGLLTVSSGGSIAVGTPFDQYLNASGQVAIPAGTNVLNMLTSSTYIVNYAPPAAVNFSNLTASFLGLYVTFQKPPNPDAQYGQGFSNMVGALQFPALLPKPAQLPAAATPSSPELEARPQIPPNTNVTNAVAPQSTEIVFYTGVWGTPNGTGVNNGAGNSVVINYPLFYAGHAINLFADDVEVSIDTYGFSQGQAYLNGGGGGWRVPRARSLYNDMRQDTGTFRAQDCYYLDDTPGPMQLGSGPGSVHFASGDQTIEPQQASTQTGGTFNLGSNRPIDLIVDGARCWCPNAAALAVVATSGTQGLMLTTQNRTTVRNSFLSSGAPTAVVNVSNQNSTLSCQLYLENTDIDGWFQDASNAGGIAVSGVSGPAILSIGRNVRVLNAANQAMSATGISQVFMSDDFLAGQPQIDRVLYRSSSSHTVGSVVYPSLNWVPMPTALIASQNSVIAGEFQAPAAAPVSGASGSALQVGSPSFAIDGTRVRARLTYIPTGVYALFIGGQASYVVLESITALPISGSAASGIRLSSQAQNVNISSLHFEKITGTLIAVSGNATYYTNTGDIWGPPNLAPFPFVPSPAFKAMA